MTKLAELLAELKALHLTYAESDKRAMEAGAWTDEEWAINRQYWGVVNKILAEMRAIVAEGKLIRVKKLDTDSFDVGTIGACYDSDGFPMILFSPEQNAEWTIAGFRLDFVESLEVAND